jgi:predicted GNAT superfamily acetyltransferase
MLWTDESRTAPGHTGQMPSTARPQSMLSQAEQAAASAAARAGVTISDQSDMDALLDVASLLSQVWGTSQHGAPIPADVLRSIAHAGCNITAAHDADGTLCGAAVAIVSTDASMYSLIAGVLPETADTGVGFALKLHQRAWALARGLEKMIWTFDPLVSRNARFNLTKLGANTSEYVRDFYGTMLDDINANDESDRLVAVWPLATQETVARSIGQAEPLEFPDFSASQVLANGPDGEPFLLQGASALWCRVPRDIVALRSQAPAEAGAWRLAVRDAFEAAFASGHTASDVTRTGWYRLSTEGQ